MILSAIQAAIAGTRLGSPGDIALTYSSDGDANGVFTYLGKLGNGGVWRNPHTNGDIVIAASNLASGTLDSIVDHATSDAFDDPQLSPWFSFDLGAGRSLITNKGSFRERSAGGDSSPFDVEGSNDGTTWTPILTGVVIDQATNVWTSFDLDPSGVGYRYFRIIRTGTTDYFTIGEFELYGTLSVTKFVYISDGDENGVFTYLGKLGNGGVWRNPNANGDIVLACSDLEGGNNLNDVVNHDSSSTGTNGGVGEWISFDLKSGRSLLCSKCSYRVRHSTDVNNPSAFDLEASNDGSSWTLLSSQTGAPTSTDTWLTFDVSAATAYRYFRLKVPDSAGTAFMTTGEVELYGELSL